MRNLKAVLLPYLEHRYGPLEYKELYELFGRICFEQKDEIPKGWSSHELVEAAFQEDLLIWDEEEDVYYVNRNKL